MYRRGFTLPELLICIAIIGIVTSMTLVKYSAFDSTVLAKSAAYEIALTLREAQINSVSVRRGDDDGTAVFSYPYGVHFVKGESGYTAYVYEDSDKDANPMYDVGIADPGDEIAREIGTFTLDRGMAIEEICINGGTCNIETLDISFKRPEFNALFRAINDGGTILGNDNIQSATIEVKSPAGVLSFIVRVSTLGQIEVYKKD